MKIYILIIVLILSALSTAVMADVPPLISYQGKLMQPNGTPIPDGTYSIRFAIYSVPADGDMLWSETISNVQVKGGLFAVLLGSVNNLGANILDSEARYLGIKVGNDDELIPRQRIASVATALRAGEADIAKTVLDGAITTSKLADEAVTADKIANGAIGGEQLASNTALVAPVMTSPVFKGSIDGWVGADETWTYISPSSFNISGDVTGQKYAVGDKIALKQGGAHKYFYISALPTYSSGVTTVTITGGSDYTLADAPITDNCYSKVATPVGFPQYFNVATPAFTGISNGSGGQPAVSTMRFTIMGRTCHAFVRATGVKAGLGYLIWFNNTFPAPRQITGALGSCHIYTGSKDYIGITTISGTRGYAEFSANIPDATVFTEFTMMFIYEI